jgi:hypothetical protein
MNHCFLKVPQGKKVILMILENHVQMKKNRRSERHEISVCLFLLLLIYCQNAFAEETTLTNNSNALSNRTLNRKVPMATLLGSAIGQSTRPSVYDWRKSTWTLEVSGAQIVEYNTFESRKFGLKARSAFNATYLTLAWHLVQTNTTAASEVISKTPYRQAGRPSRHEVTLGVEMALAEGISTWLPSFLPESQMILFVTADLTLVHYPKAWAQNQGIEKLSSLIKPTLSEAEINSLSQSRPAGMAVNTSRYFTGLGTRLDLMAANGFFATSSLSVLLPILKGDNALGYVVIPSLGAGYAFSAQK